MKQGQIILRSADHPDLQPKDDDDPLVAPARTTAILPIPVARHGLGDWVYSWAHPTGCWIDQRTAKMPLRWRTKLCGCLACSGRRQRWNVLLPDLRRWKGGWQVACSAIAKGMLAAFLKVVDRVF